jgi:hypothetical protein
MSYPFGDFSHAATVSSNPKSVQDVKFTEGHDVQVDQLIIGRVDQIVIAKVNQLRSSSL